MVFGITKGRSASCKMKQMPMTPSDENRQVAPGRKPNAEVRTREYLTVAEVERLVKYAFIAI